MENMAWDKRLRLGRAELINSRLAKRITWEEYTSIRELADRDLAECRRRAAILAAELTRRSMY